jgi:hypothetical protein
MEKQSIAIAGLGKVGSAFLEEWLGQSNPRVEMGDELDILFDLTDVTAVRQELREELRASGNRHTIIATENIARMIWALIASGVNLPSAQAKPGADYPRGYACD